MNALYSTGHTPIISGDVQTRMPGITTALYQQYGASLNWMIAVNDLYFDFAIPTLRTLGVPASGPPQMVSGGDGSVSAYDRVRQGQYQANAVDRKSTRLNSSHT